MHITNLARQFEVSHKHRRKTREEHTVDIHRCFTWVVLHSFTVHSLYLRKKMQDNKDKI